MGGVQDGWESAWLENTQSRALTWNPDMTGASGLCHKTMNNTRPKWQNPGVPNEGHQEQDRNMTAQEHEYTRLTHNRKEKSKQKQRGEGGKPSQWQQGSSTSPGRDGLGRRRQGEALVRLRDGQQGEVLGMRNVKLNVIYIWHFCPPHFWNVDYSKWLFLSLYKRISGWLF